MRRRHHSKDSNASHASSASNSLDKYFSKGSQPPKPTTFDSVWRSPSNNGPEPTQMPCKDTILYPKNPEVRTYQLSIVRTCLFHNTLVCLPTGLGKTHIASVVMLNYYLGFPSSKIYFLAPTRPLVYQQKNSLAGFYEYIREGDIIQLNGSLNSKVRKGYYKNRRIFFLTPQTLENDLEENRCEVNATSLIILDEAHRATGSYAYVNIVKNLQKTNIGFRVVGLSATPGNTIEQVQEVITNLKISRLQVKDQSDPDVKPYVHNKQIQAVQIKSTEIINLAEKIIDSFMNKPAKIIVAKQAVEGHIVNLMKMRGLNQGIYWQMYQSFKNNEAEHKIRLDSKEIGLVYASFKILKYLVDGKKTLRQQGYESFQSFLTKFKEKKDERTGKSIPFLQQIIQSQDFRKLQELTKDGGNHPKLMKLQQLLSEFFSSKDSVQNQSKAIVFTHHRTSAMQIQRSLSDIPIIKPYIFVGQSKTLEITTDSITNAESISYIQMKQKQQIEVIRKFKQNQLNTLISTSIGEEGLDIGEVDLIICYDNGMSPIRMVQRMGRTGRKRNGKVVLLLMQGKEMQSYRKATDKSKNLKTVIRENALGKKPQKVKFQFYSFNSTMFLQNKNYELVYVDNQKPKGEEQQLEGEQDSNSEEQEQEKPRKDRRKTKTGQETKKKGKEQEKIQMGELQTVDEGALQHSTKQWQAQQCDVSQDSDTMVRYLLELDP